MLFGVRRAKNSNLFSKKFQSANYCEKKNQYAPIHFPLGNYSFYNYFRYTVNWILRDGTKLETKGDEGIVLIRIIK
jgi:hypothetical protein